jgi:hypothetical protein
MPIRLPHNFYFYKACVEGKPHTCSPPQGTVCQHLKPVALYAYSFHFLSRLESSRFLANNRKAAQMTLKKTAQRTFIKQTVTTKVIIRYFHRNLSI